MSAGVLAWWSALCAVSLVNLWGWHLSARFAWRRAHTQPAVFLFQRRQLLLSAVYVLGCAFRSVLPRADVQRIGLFDSWMSSVMVGRSVATVAELAFVAQWALLLNKMARDEESRFGVIVSWLLVPLIAVAETFSWYSVLTTSYIGNVCEESIWAVSATLLILSCLVLLPGCRRASRPFLVLAAALAFAYVVFMVTVDVPMYVTRYVADEAAGRPYLSLDQGMSDVWNRWVVTYEWEHWRTEMPWMSLYFSVAVWCSIALVHADRFAQRSRVEPLGWEQA